MSSRSTGEPAGFKDWGTISDQEWNRTVANTKTSGQIRSGFGGAEYLLPASSPRGRSAACRWAGSAALTSWIPARRYGLGTPTRF